MTNFALLDQMLAETNRRMDAVNANAAEPYTSEDIAPGEGVTFYTEEERASVRVCKEPERFTPRPSQGEDRVLVTQAGYRR